MHEVNTYDGVHAEDLSHNRIGKAQEESFPVEAATERLPEPTGTAELQSQDQRIEEIATNILSHKGRIVQSFLEIGNLLIEAKALLTRHGQWMNWLDTEVNISYRMAERYMQLARAYANSTSVTNLGITKALALLALPDADRETFIERPHKINGKQKRVNEMSVRELKQIIHEKTKTIEKKQHPIPLEVVRKETWAYKKASRELETAQELLIGVEKFLGDPPSNPIPEKISNSLRSLYESAKNCMVLANLEI